MSRPRAKRILGMTSPQWLVLGILLLCLCTVVVGGFTWLNSIVSKALAVPEVNLPEVTPLPTFTAPPAATLAPTLTPTPITYESLIPAGWKHFRPETMSNLEIWFPESYSRQNEKDQKNAIRVVGGEDDETVVSLLRLKDNTPSNYKLVTTFELATRPLDGSDLDAMLDTQFGALMREGRLLERGTFVFTIGTLPARRLIFDINVNGTDAGLAIYVVQSGKDLYFLSFATSFNELYTRLPAFDQSIQTLRIVLIIPTTTPSLTAPAPTNTNLP